MPLRAFLSTALLLASGGCVDTAPEPTATRQQALGARCTLLRPYGWAGSNISCFEPQYINTPLSMADGDTYNAATVASPAIGDGYGAASVQCSNGTIVVLSSTCTRVSGPPD